MPGICDPAVDALIEKVIAADDRPALQAAARALDRVLLWRWYMVPNWDNLVFHVAYWDRFGHPDKPIREGFNFDTWWVDPAKAAATDAARGRDASSPISSSRVLHAGEVETRQSCEE